MLSRYLSAACGLFAVLAACACETPRTEQVVLEVGGRPVSLGEFDRFVQTSVQQESPVLSSEVMSALFDEFIEEQLLLRAADDAGIQADPRAVAKRVESLQRMDSGAAPSSEGKDTSAGKAASENDGKGEGGDAAPLFRNDRAATAGNVERQMRIEQVVATEALAGIKVPDDEIAAYYDAHRDDFVRPETVDVSQILVDDEALANELRKTLLAKTTTFEDLARERSQAPDARNGGHLGTFAHGELPPSFEAQVFALKPGTLSEVVATDFGFHIFRLNARTERQQLGLDDVREAIRVDLLREKSDEAMKRYVAELEKRYPVKVHHEHLTFAVADRDTNTSGSGEHSVRMEKSK
jgi:peptidyl-prolyl cis-trans isomerase C